MAWYTEQIFADFLNQNNNHVGATKALTLILSDDVVLNYGTSTYRGSIEVVAFLEEIHQVISSDQGFTAKPVITEDKSGKRKKAVGLFSKLEVYVSWLFRIYASGDTWQITNIDAERPDGYELYYDLYVEGNYDDDGNVISDDKL